MTEDDLAWNNFVMLSDVADENQAYRSAAIANLYMSGANNGGINSFLASTPELSSNEVLKALEDIGAKIATIQLLKILRKLGEPLPPSSAEHRWDLLDSYWRDELDDLDILSQEADDELMASLGRHVASHRAYYLSLRNSQ